MRSMGTARLFDLAKTIRSKNAGVDRITFDVIFSDKETYDASGVAACYRAPRSAGFFVSSPTASLIMWNSTRLLRSSSPSAGGFRAAARATAISSAVSSMDRCLT
jgi:hypothetical protein